MDKNGEIIQLLCEICNKLGEKIDKEKISFINRENPHKIQKNT